MNDINTQALEEALTLIDSLLYTFEARRYMKHQEYHKLWLHEDIHIIDLIRWSMFHELWYS